MRSAARPFVRIPRRRCGGDRCDRRGDRDVLAVIAPIVGLPCIVAAAPNVAMALGYDTVFAAYAYLQPAAGPGNSEVRRSTGVVSRKIAHS
jgi:hypothetical protein